MLTLEVKSNGEAGDGSLIASIAYNTGMVVVATLPDGTTITATPDLELPEVNEPHPVLEPPVVEPVVVEPVVVEPVVVEPVVVTESSP